MSDAPANTLFSDAQIEDILNALIDIMKGDFDRRLRSPIRKAISIPFTWRSIWPRGIGPQDRFQRIRGERFAVVGGHSFVVMLR